MGEFIKLFQISQTYLKKIIYITNIIESAHRQFRKLTKTKESFQNKNSLLKNSILESIILKRSGQWQFVIEV